MSKINIVMDASKFDLFRLCEARYYYRHKLNKSTPTKAKPLDRGTLVHVGNEFYYDLISKGTSYQDAVNVALSKVREAGAISSDLEIEDINRILEVLEEYYDYWRIADQNLRIKAVEQPFLYTLHEDDDVRIMMSGKIDILYDDDKYTNLPMDHKSVERESEVIRMSNQFKNYCYATESKILIVNRIGFQKTLKPHEKYKRIPVSYDDLILEEWKQNVIKVMFYYLECEARESWPMNETSCDKYYRRCEYYDICDSSGKEAKMYKLSANYIDVEPWDVSKILRKASEVLNDSKRTD